MITLDAVLFVTPTPSLLKKGRDHLPLRWWSVVRLRQWCVACRPQETITYGIGQT